MLHQKRARLIRPVTCDCHRVWIKTRGNFECRIEMRAPALCASDIVNVSVE